jgi:MAF protein
MTTPIRLYLASSSPRRRQLVRSLGLPVTIGLAPVDEAALQGAYTGPREDLAEHLARHKAEAAARAIAADPSGGDSDDLLALGADTTVLLEGRVLGKPSDPAESVRMLRALRGRRHTVVTGVALARPAAADGDSGLRSVRVATAVTMRDYSDGEIAAYVATGDPLDKAGSYGVQHPDFQPVARIAGCYTAVVGLPLCAVAALIAELTGTPPQPAVPTAPCPWFVRCRAPLPEFARTA